MADILDGVKKKGDESLQSNFCLLFPEKKIFFNVNVK
jgi:hypothetical protein